MSPARYLPLFCILAGAVPALESIAAPPQPPLGCRWVLNQEFSDEFNGDSLDARKWNTYYPGWSGRPPGWFNPEAVSLSGGNLQIRSGVMDKPRGPYTLYGGAVTSKSANAHFGYYECRVKASRIKMSTTFWMSNSKVPLEETDCPTDTYSQELDILECVGGSLDSENPGFRKKMNSNTHFRHVACGKDEEKFYSKGAKMALESEVWEDFHVYGAWWMDAGAVRFYADGEFFDCIHPYSGLKSEPFDRPMQLNMVTETYNWQPPPTREELMNNAINTAYYDWVRSYRLVPVGEPVIYAEELVPVHNEGLVLIGLGAEEKPGSPIEFKYEFKANSNRRICITIRDSADTVLQESIIPAYAGHGHGEWTEGAVLPVRENEVVTLVVALETEGGELLKRIEKKIEFKRK